MYVGYLAKVQGFFLGNKVCIFPDSCVTILTQKISLLTLSMIKYGKCCFKEFPHIFLYHFLFLKESPHWFLYQLQQMQNERKKLMRFTNSNKHNVPYCESNTCLVQIKKKRINGANLSTTTLTYKGRNLRSRTKNLRFHEWLSGLAWHRLWLVELAWVSNNDHVP